MLKGTKSYTCLFVLLFIPYVVLCFFAHPVADDFGYTQKTLGWGFWQAQQHDFFYWNGRYASNALLLANPMVWGSFTMYRLSALVLILLTPLCFYFFLSAIFRQLFSTSQKLLGALAFSVLYFGIMPDISEGLYWFTGAMTYVLANLLTIVYISLVALYLQKRFIVNQFIHALKCIVLLFIVIGFNEVNTLVLIIGHLVVLLALRKEKQLLTTILILTLLTIAFSLIMILAPGNAQRGSFFTGNYHIVHSLYMTGLQIIRFFLKWISFPPLLLASLLFIPIGQKLYDTSSLFQKLAGLKLWQVFFLLCLIIFLCVFPAYWGTGILGQHRTLNTACFFFILLWLVFVFILSKRFNITQHVLAMPDKMKYWVTIIFITCLLISGNSGRALFEFGTGQITGFNNELNERYTKLETAKQQGIKSVTLPTLKNRPTSLFVLDIQSGCDHWMNKSYALYFKVEQVCTDSIR
jgi:hypothetical protein